MKHHSANTLKKMSKKELISYINSLTLSIDLDHYTEDDVNDSYDRGYDAGYYAAKEESPEEIDIEDYDNVIRFG